MLTEGISTLVGQDLTKFIDIFLVHVAGERPIIAVGHQETGNLATADHQAGCHVREVGFT